MSLKGFNEALARGRDIESLDRNFQLDKTQDLTQGANNRVLSDRFARNDSRTGTHKNAAPQFCMTGQIAVCANRAPVANAYIVSDTAKTVNHNHITQSNS